MTENSKLSELLKRAQTEENLYNWAEAARLYEQAGKSYLNKKKVKEAAIAYKCLGRVYFLAFETVDTKAEYVESLKLAIEAYNKAKNLFKQDKNKAEELECEAEALFANGFISSSTSDAKKSYSNSSDLFVEASNIFSKSDDQESKARSLTRAAFSFIFLQPFSENKLEADQLFQKGISLASEALKISSNVDNLRIFSEIIFSELIINLTKVFLKDFKKEPSFKEYLKNNMLKFDEYIKLFYNSDDNRALAMIYSMAGFLYCLYATHYIKDEKEFYEYTDKGLKLLEETLAFARKANNKFLIIFNLYYIDWFALFARRFKYIQNRIFKDVKEIEDLREIYSHSYNPYRFYADFFPVFYYANMALRSFFTIRQRKTYAKKGIEFAKYTLKGSSPLFYRYLPYQMLTYSYSQLTSLATSKEERDEYVEKMFKYAQKAHDLGEKYEGGMIRAAGFSSLYRAYKTRAELSEDKERKIEMLSAAADASKKYLEHTPEQWRGILFGQIRLALLYEEIGIITGENDTLLQAEEVYKNIIKDALDSGYYFYAAAAYEYLARIEDRLGNYMISAEQYGQVQECYSKSVIGVEYKLLKERIKEKISYANAWNLIELAKLHNKQENHLQAKENYTKACQILKELPSNNYEASYYFAWTFLEEAEHLSKQERHDDATEQFEFSSRHFNEASNVLQEVLKQSKDKLENERINNLKNVAKVRINYCNARMNVENARILGKKGEHFLAAKEFSSAASQFKAICNNFKLERERRELEAIYHLCKAWESMEFAENYKDSNKFAEAAHLFEKASSFFSNNKLKILSSSNSAFCEALELGCRFDESTETSIKSELYPKIKVILRKAASSYKKGGFINEADWALATSTYFDAAWHLIQADEEMNLKKKKDLLKIGSEILHSAANLFGKAGYKNKENEILEQLELVAKEERIIVSALNTISEPSITKSTVGIIAPACPLESSQSPRISEVREFSDEILEAEIIEGPREKYKLIYKDLLKDHPERQQKEFRVGIAQIGISTEGDLLGEFYTEDNGLLNLRKDKVDIISRKVIDMIKNAHNNRVNILIFPEMAIDLNYSTLLKDISNLAKEYNIYIIPGSYHDPATRRNLSLVISPEGILWEQEKNIPAMISFKGTRFKEGIESGRMPRKVKICNTEYGRIAIAICRDFLDMDLRVELKNFEPPVDIIFNPAFTPVTADFKAAHFDARRSIYAYCFFANIGEYGNSLIYTPEKERTERAIPPKEEGLIYKDIDLFKLRSERKKWQKINEKEKQFIQSTR
ncbi:MAG: carbon-nitrogen hydrolase family protein [Promethearchaeota archaeon]|nr:MAG: carbon-nitrogen hydrolase family protein [Candidatus Lokiarchaeota archaeon]